MPPTKTLTRRRLLSATASLLIFCTSSVGTLVPASAQATKAEANRAETHRTEVNRSEANKSETIKSDTALERTRFVLNRLTYGPKPGDVEAVEKMGVERFIEEQLHPQSLKQPDWLVQLAQSKPALNQTPAELYINFVLPANQAQKQQKNTSDPNKDPLNYIREVHKLMYADVGEVRLARAIFSPQQLQEVMTDFWFNHFNISADKGLDYAWVGSYEETAIRPYTMGSFRQLLGATAHHAAMLFYLDNWQNSAPNQANRQNSRPGNDRFKGLNENYARELMELHTLGVDGGYTQKDVIELARVLTGLGIRKGRGAGRGQPAQAGGGIHNPFGDTFDASRHDFGDKVLLGKTIKGSGEGEIEEALTILANHPATAHHISYQLAQYFVSDNPPSSLVDKLSKTYMATGGNISSMLNVLFHSSEFYAPQYRGAKFKSPYRYVISSLRATDIQPEKTQPLLAFLTLQGMPLYRCLTPDGYKNTQDAWLNSDALVNRINFATGVGTGKVPPLQPRIHGYEDLQSVIGNTLSATTAKTIDNAPEQMKVGLLLGSPEFMRY